MSESSPENSGQPPVAEGQAEEAKVPVAAVAKERAEKRAARAEADQLKQELDEQKKTSKSDMAALIESLGPFIAEQVASATKAALQPIQQEATQVKTALSLGLNEVQANELWKLQAETPGLSDQRALAILRVEKPDLFTAPRQATAIAPTGISQSRTGGQSPNHVAEMTKARQEGRMDDAQKHATAELFRRFDAARARFRG